MSQDDPLFVDLTMFPELPTATKVLLPKEKGLLYTTEAAEEMNNDEVAKSIEKVILEELGEEFIQSLSDTSEK